MKGDVIFYLFSRSKVERCDFSHFLSLYAPDICLSFAIYAK